ncbi:hypothetical protein RchiOBHm_Chr6g0247801 [Rosa chinensis]|uniref:Formin-like protein 18 n=1 Tax=Rosa chinensis TaxID=74649 RepID=A0A2P6PJW0_ROSCH|nr:uncharacterized protein LOC112173308 [Rosa chinensis]PRQ22213.1 hypothetical protein RchiOBHm_Chr6g0247801 [Rosa chinensis]
MDPCPFVRILIGDLTLKFPSVSKPSFSTVHPSSSPCFCKIKLTNFPHQFSAVPLILDDSASAAQTTTTTTSAARSHSLNACFNLTKPQIETLASKRPSLSISIYTGRRGATCGLNSAKLLGRVTVPLAELSTALSRPVVYQNGWIGIGGKKSGSGSSQSQFFLSVRAEPDPRFVFKFDGEPECSPQVFQVQGNVKQPVFTCKFGFRNASDLQSRSMSEPGTPRNWLVPFMGGSQKEQSAKERKGWSLTIHDLSGSPVAAASMVTPFVASPGSQRVSRSNPGAWLILRPEDGTWKPWGRLETWLERGGSDTVGYKFELLSTILANSTVSASNGGKFTIDLTSSLTPVNSPHSSFDLGSGSGSSRPGSGSGSDFGFGLIPQLLQRGFVMSSTVEGIGKCSKPEVEVGVQHVTCTEDAAAYVALAAAMDLSMDACRPFSHKLRKELRQ